MTPSHYYYLPISQAWVKSGEFEANLAREQGFFVVFWVSYRPPNRHDYSKLFEVRFHYYADEAISDENLRFRNVWKG